MSRLALNSINKSQGLYLLKHPDSQIIKIGMSKNLFRRINSLMYRYHYGELEILSVCYNRDLDKVLQLEKQLQKRFEDNQVNFKMKVIHKINGKEYSFIDNKLMNGGASWYNLDSEKIKYIDSIFKEFNET